MTSSVSLFLVVVGVLALVGASLQASAVCNFVPTGDGPSGLSGKATFTFDASAGQTTVSLSVSGLADGEYGVHVHQWGDITDLVKGSTAGAHFSVDPSAPHACPPDINRHDGDMGNWLASGGSINMQKTLDKLRLTDINSILGRAVVLHSNGDDCVTSPTGKSGDRIGVCVIALPNQAGNDATPSSTLSKYATCQLRGTSNCPNCKGTVWLEETSPGTIHIRASVAGLSFGSSHGFHIHQYGDLSDTTSGTSLGAHWNPDNSSHGIPPNTPRHRGDLGSINVYDQTGQAYYDYTTDYIGTLASIIGRGFVVHQTFDHGSGLGCDATGNSGVRYAMCAIGSAEKLTVQSPPSGTRFPNDWTSVPCGSAVAVSQHSMLVVLMLCIVALTMLW